MDQELTKPIVIRPVRSGSILRNKLIQYLILIPVCWGLPFLISPYLNAQSNFAGVILLIPWGLSCIFLVNLFFNFGEYRKAVLLDQEGIQIIVPVKAKFNENVKRSTDADGDLGLFFGLYKYNVYILEYELPGINHYWGYVSEKVYLNSEVGKMVAVRYMGDNPEIQRIES